VQRAVLQVFALTAYSRSLRLIQESRSRTVASVDPLNLFTFHQLKERTMPHRKSPATKPHSKQSNQMGQSSGDKRQQGAAGSSRQGGSGSMSMKRQQTAQDVGKTQDDELVAGRRSTRRSDDLEVEEDVERAGLTRDDDSDIESR
jgi:hypothetical protein